MASPTKRNSSRRWRKMSANLKAEMNPCWLCGQPIDYSLSPDHPMAFSVDHRLPYSTHPHLREDPANLYAAHSKCNKSRGNREPQPRLGVRSRDW